MKQTDTQSKDISDRALERMLYDLLDGLKEFAVETACAKAAADLAVLPPGRRNRHVQHASGLQRRFACPMKPATEVRPVVNGQLVSFSTPAPVFNRLEQEKPIAAEVIQFPGNQVLDDNND